MAPACRDVKLNPELIYVSRLCCPSHIFTLRPCDRAAVDTVRLEGLVSPFSGNEFEFQTNFIVNLDDGMDWWLRGDTRRGSFKSKG
jgi:hypothetical protein